jgi:hypothetical protein
MGGACSVHGEMRNTYTICVGKPEGTKALGRAGHKLGNSTKLDLTEIGPEGVNWLNVAQVTDLWSPHVITVVNLRVP